MQNITLVLKNISIKRASMDITLLSLNFLELGEMYEI